MKVLFLFLLTNLCFGEVVNFSSDDYEKSLNAKSKIVFNMESTKAGIITTSFQGVVKEFNLDYKLTNNTFENVTLILKANSLDTDIDGRNEKMHELCLSAKEFSNIIIRLKEDYVVGNEKEVAGQIKIKSSWYPIVIKIESEKSDGLIKLKGSSSVSLKKLSIPDPSIWIASVRDRVDIEFNLELNTLK